MIEIRISGAGTEGIFDQIRQHTHAEVEADCEPSGYEIILSVSPPYRNDAILRLGSREIDLGEVNVVFEHEIASKTAS